MLTRALVDNMVVYLRCVVTSGCVSPRGISLVANCLQSVIFYPLNLNTVDSDIISMRIVKEAEGMELFGECFADWYEWHDNHFNWCVYHTYKPLSRENRAKLKSLGWRLHRHERTNKEYWSSPVVKQ